MQIGFIFVAWAWNVRVQTRGSLAKQRPLLLVANHFSYIDLIALGSVAPAGFVAKIEIASWPALGAMCKASGCLFIDRKISKTLENRNKLSAALKFGDVIGLFPEGTTGDGVQLLPFKTSLFSIAEHTGLDVQPVSIAYIAANGKPIDARTRELVGWRNGDSLLPHVARFLRQKGLDVKVSFLPKINGKDFASRREVAKYCSEAIDESLSRESRF
jgi:lyso-ornithine lipid O-acyltransferase